MTAQVLPMLRILGVVGAWLVALLSEKTDLTDHCHCNCTCSIEHRPVVCETTSWWWEFCKLSLAVFLGVLLTLWKSFKWIFEQGLDLWSWVNQRALDCTDPVPPPEAITGTSLTPPNTVEVQTLAREQLNRVKRRQEERSKHGSL